MLLILGYLLISLAAVSLYSLAAGFVLWRSVLLFLACFILGNAVTVLFFWICALFIDAGKPLERQSRLCRIGCRAIGSIAAVYGGLRVHLTGMERLPEGERFLLVCNHRSGLDPLAVLWKLWRYNISFVSKPSNMRLPFLGRIAYGAGFLPIDRENDRSALKTILTAADYMKRGICSIGIYPEGTRSKTGELGDFHAGSFKIAQRAGAPVVIACIRGTEQALARLPRRTDVFLDFLEILPPETVREKTTAELAAYSRALIAEHLQRKQEEDRE